MNTQKSQGPLGLTYFWCYSLFWHNINAYLILHISVSVFTDSDCRVHVCLPTNRPQKDRDDAFKGQTQSPYSLLTPMTPQQIKPPAPGSDQLQSAIKKLQQQSLRSRQFLDQSHRGQQVQRRAFFFSALNWKCNVSVAGCLDGYF